MFYKITLLWILRAISSFVQHIIMWIWKELFIHSAKNWLRINNKENTINQKSSERQSKLYRTHWYRCAYSMCRNVRTMPPLDSAKSAVHFWRIQVGKHIANYYCLLIQRLWSARYAAEITVYGKVHAFRIWRIPREPNSRSFRKCYKNDCTGMLAHQTKEKSPDTEQTVMNAHLSTLFAPVSNV